MIEDCSVTRRTALKTLGASTVGLTAGANAVVAAGTNAQLVFVYDDSPVQDYTKTFPVHKSEGVPGCIAAIADGIGSNYRYLNEHQLHEIADAGWEVMSHTIHHRALGPIKVTDDVSPDDTKIQVSYARHALIPGDTLLVTDGDKEATVTVAGGKKIGNNEYILTKNPVGESFSASDGVYERYTDDILKHALGGSKRILEDMGFTVTNLVYPFGRRGPRTEKLVPKYYEGVGNFNYDGLNPGTNVNPYHVGRTYYNNDDLKKKEVGQFLDKVVERDALGMFASHSSNDHFTQDRIRLAIREAKRRNIDIVTLREAFENEDVIQTPMTPKSTAPKPKAPKSDDAENRGDTKFVDVVNAVSYEDTDLDETPDADVDGFENDRYEAPLEWKSAPGVLRRSRTLDHESILIQWRFDDR